MQQLRAVGHRYLPGLRRPLAFARNVFEQAQGLASRRLFSEDLSTLSDEQLMQLSTEDVMGAVANILKGFGLANVA